MLNLVKLMLLFLFAFNLTYSQEFNGLIVKYKSGSISKQSGDFSSLKLVKLSKNEDIKAKINYYKNLPNVEYVEPNYIIKKQIQHLMTLTILNNGA
ncbi:MAG: hypothetical protein N2Z81_07370 [Hydrogenothermaceae bacterium]|nr:hypothetical protein [Hydrogenothermaceae bacterium]